MKKHYDRLVCFKHSDSKWTIASKWFMESMIVYSKFEFEELPQQLKEKLAILMCGPCGFYDESIGVNVSNMNYIIYDIYL